MRKIVLFFSLTLAMLSLGHTKTLAEDLNTLIDKSLPEANVGVLIKDLQSGKIVYARNSNKLFNPASNIKLLTAAAALYQLGQNFQFNTSLSQIGKNFYLTFNGSPSLSIENLKQLFSKLPALGINNIQGNIIVDSSHFKAPYYPAGESYDDLGWYYAAPSTAVILNENAVAYDFSATTLGKLIEIKPLSTASPLTLINEVVTVSKAEEKNHCSLHIEIKPQNTLRLYGCLAQDKNPKRMRLAVPNPVILAKQVIKQALVENKISLQGKIITGKTPAQTHLIAQHQSKNINKLLTHMLEESDNLYADSFTKQLAFAITGEGSYKQGAFAIKKILAEHSSLDTKKIKLVDGCGTRYNLLTPEQIVTLLTEVYQDEKIKTVFINSLARMGSSGTLKDRMKNTQLKDRILAKTGTMHDTSALSGYLKLSGGQTYVFSIISNNVNGNVSIAKNLEEKILLLAFSRLEEIIHRDSRQFA